MNVIKTEKLFKISIPMMIMSSLFHWFSLVLIVPYTSSSAGQRAFSVVGPRIFNNLPVNVSSIETPDNFKVALKTYLFTLSPHDVEKLYF